MTAGTASAFACAPALPTATHPTPPPRRYFIPTSRGLVHCQEASANGAAGTAASSASAPASAPPVIALVTITSFGNTVVAEVLNDLARRGYRALAIDIMGYGHSDRRQDDWSVEDFADNVAEALAGAGVASGVPDVLACGHFSSWMGIELARRPAFSAVKLVLDGTPIIDEAGRRAALDKALGAPRAWREDGEQTLGYWKVVHHILKTLNPTLSFDGVPSARVREAYLSVLGTLSFEPGTAYAAAHFDAVSSLAALTQKIVVMCGDHDWNLPHHATMVEGLSRADVETVRWHGVHPLHDLQDRSRTHLYADVLDRLARGVPVQKPA